MKPTTTTECLFAVDTNILIYLEGNDTHKRRIAEELLLDNPVISSQVISEFINVTRRLRNISKTQLIIEVANLFCYCPIMPISHSILQRATQLIARYDFQVFDSIIVASAVESGCKILYSEDMHRNLIVDGQLTIVNPFIQRT
jgi:predicted nucleic acid-binding protein